VPLCCVVLFRGRRTARRLTYDAVATELSGSRRCVSVMDERPAIAPSRMPTRIERPPMLNGVPKPRTRRRIR